MTGLWSSFLNQAVVDRCDRRTFTGDLGRDTLQDLAGCFARLSTKILNSDWPSRSMSRRNNQVRRVDYGGGVCMPITPKAVIRSPTIPTSPRNQDTPVPSMIRPLLMSTSKRDARRWAAGARLKTSTVIANHPGKRGSSHPENLSELAAISKKPGLVHNSASWPGSLRLITRCYCSIW